MKSKKYYTIGEVTKLLNIPASQIRYLENIILNFNIIKVKGRRYYTAENIEVLKNKISSTRKLSSSTVSHLIVNGHPMLDEINQLLSDFNKLAFKIERNLIL